MPRYSVSDRNQGAVTNNNRIGALWNPSSTIPVWLELIVFITSDTSRTQAYNLRRVTARGTPGSTTTPDVDNDVDLQVAPPSGLVLDLPPYSVLPTEDASILEQIRGYDTAPENGSGVIIELDPPIKIPPGTGLMLRNSNDPFGAGDMTFTWSE